MSTLSQPLFLVLPAVKLNFQHSCQPPYAFIKHFQTGPTQLQQPLPAVSVSLFLRLSSGMDNLPELTLASKPQSCPTAAQETPALHSHDTFAPHPQPKKTKARAGAQGFPDGGRGGVEDGSRRPTAPPDPRSCNQANQGASLG